MKKVALGLALIGALGMMSFSTKGPNLSKELKSKIKVHNPLNFNQKDFVLVSFHIQEGQIVIDQMNGSNDHLKEEIKEQLSTLNVKSNYQENKSYQYKFTFKVE